MADLNLKGRITLQNDASKSINEVKQSMTSLISSQGVMGGMVGGLMGGGMMGMANAAIDSLAQVPQAIGEAVDAASKLQVLRQSFDGLAGSAGQASDTMLAAMRRASFGMVSDSDLMLSANRAMSLGVADNADEMATLLDIARVKGQAMGLSLTQAFNDLVTGLGRGSAEILDNLGITIDTQKVMGDYAKTLGTTAEALDKTQKMQALLNEVMRQAGTMTAGAGMPSGAAMAQAQLQRAQEEAQVATGNFWASPVREAAQLQTDAINMVTGKYNSLAVAVRDARDSLADWPDTFEPEQAERMLAFVNAVDLLSVAQENGFSGAVRYKRVLEEMQDAAKLGQLSDTQALYIEQVTNQINAQIAAREELIAGAIAADGAMMGEINAMEGAAAAAAATQAKLEEMAAKLGWVGQAALAAATDVAGFNAEVARIQGNLSVTAGIRSSAQSKILADAQQAVAAGGDPAVIEQMVRDASAAVGGLWLEVNSASDAQFRNMQRTQGATESLADYTKRLEDAEAAAKKLATSGLADMNKALDDIKSKASSVITGALQTDVKVENQPYQDGVNENSKRLADIANKGFAGQSWMEEFKTEAAGVYEELKKVEDAGGDVKAKAAEIFANVQAGLDLRTLDRGMIKQRVKDMILGDANVAALAAEIAQELSQEMGVPLAQVQATAKTALGLPDEDSAGGKGGAETKGDTGKATGQAAGGAFGTGFIAGIDGPAIAASAIASIAVGFLLNEKKVRGSGAVVGAWWGEGFMGTVGANVPPGLLDLLVAKLLPAILAAIAAKNGQGKPDDGSGGPP